MLPRFMIAVHVVLRRSFSYALTWLGDVIKNKIVVRHIWALESNPMSQLQGVNDICYAESHSVTWHPTQVSASRLNSSQTDQYSNVRAPEGCKAELT